jgi:molecular chaperone DnaJ
MAKRCYYEILQVERSSSDRDIAKAYRKLAVKYHPDSNPDDAEASIKFKEAAEAYDILGNPEKRVRYDQFGHAGVDGSGSSFGNAEDIMSAFSEIFGDGLFGSFFGGSRTRSRRGANVRAEVTLTLEEAASGVNKSISFTRGHRCETCHGSGARPGTHPTTCSKCGGRGQVLQSNGILRVQTTCPSCHGSGQMITDPCFDCRGYGIRKNKVELEVAIPAGVDDGMQVRLQGEGEPSPTGDGPPGDCYCLIHVRKHRLFHRDGINLILQFPITYSQAALGATLQVPTLEGPDDLVVPAGSQSGDVFKLAGRGMPDPQSRRHGDLLVQTFIETPKKLNPRQEELLRELAELENANVTPQRKSFLEKLKGYFALSDP